MRHKLVARVQAQHKMVRCHGGKIGLVAQQELSTARDTSPPDSPSVGQLVANAQLPEVLGMPGRWLPNWIWILPFASATGLFSLDSVKPGWNVASKYE